MMNLIKRITDRLHRRPILVKADYICRITGHNWKYNFASIPDKAICNRCYAKIKFDLHDLCWKKVECFEGEKRTDKELCRAWV